jgi:hypothetical protein
VLCTKERVGILVSDEAEENKNYIEGKGKI